MSYLAKKNNVALPKTIDPCPIVDALVEIRFTSSINANAVFGVIYNVMQKEFPKVETLPILQLPDSVRVSDPNLKYKPYYKISNNDFVLQIGPDVLSISSYPVYLGWDRFSQTIIDILSNIEKTQVIGKVQRIGIRYINFFQNNIFQNIDLQVLIGNHAIPYKNTVVKTEIEQGDFNSTLQIANNVTISGKKGSLIDIDTFIVKDLDSFFVKKVEIINKGHSKEKELFFNLLTKEFLASLNPKYE